ncbi:serine hydrolase domain-containing protein [Streptomyces sp. SBT349]|uniref:serine hydrolase domain-containing protein n=1 Tax=Streptomyces sp. SBT349 TaxID=1580539 RepID=UPI00066E3006|nr:serine hydrolase domain-containing protein [Streptomyces sp. SBT349]
MTDPEQRDGAEALPATRRVLAHRLAVAQAEGRAPSVVAAVVRDGRVAWSGGRGEVDPASAGNVQYRIGSLTKTVTAVQVMRLRDEGLIDLGDPLGAHLATPHGGAATIAQLLSHTGGLAAEARGPWWERTPGALRPELADVFGEEPVKHPEGRRFHYSNPGYALLGALIEKLRGGEPWFDVLRGEVLAPLGMERTTALPAEPYARGWAVHPFADVRQPEPTVDTGRMAPAGQLWSTLDDLCAFAAFLLNGNDRVLSADSIAEMRRAAVGPEASDWDAAYGLGLQLARRDGRLLAGHTGSMPGFVAGLWTSPEEGLAAVGLANATSGVHAAGLAAELLGLLAEHEPADPDPWRPLADADPELLALTGHWYWGTSLDVLRLHEGRRLSLRPAGGAGRGSRFRPEPDGTWTGLDGYFAGETLRVCRRADGSVGHLDLGTFVFTREPYDPGAPVPGGTDPEGWR